jgi:hypothetical protein
MLLFYNFIQESQCLEKKMNEVIVHLLYDYSSLLGLGLIKL